MYDFASAGHIADYLNDTVVKHPKIGPVYCAGVYDDNDVPAHKVRMQVKALPIPKMMSTPVLVEELDFTPFDIGMCNMLDGNGAPAEAAFLTRVPARRWKIGLSEVGLKPWPVRKPAPREWHPWLYSPAPTQSSWLVKDTGLYMLKGYYPSYNTAMEFMEPYERRSCAFSRDFAVWAGRLYYRWHDDPVGKCQSVPTLFAQYRMLEEQLEESLHGH